MRVIDSLVSADMLDHVLADAIGALRAALESAMLERQAIEERFTTDALLGDTRWETSYSIPGEADPPTVQADITLAWPTWSQTAYRSWYLTGELQTVPIIDSEVVIRAQGLSTPPDVSGILDPLPSSSPTMGTDRLELLPGATIETLLGDDLVVREYALEISYAGNFNLRREVLADGNQLDEIFSAAGGWISGVLIRLSDSL